MSEQSLSKVSFGGTKQSFARVPPQIAAPWIMRDVPTTLLCFPTLQQGDTTRQRLFNLAHLYDPRVPLSADVAVDAGYETTRVSHSLEWGACRRPEAGLEILPAAPTSALAGRREPKRQIANDPVLPFTPGDLPSPGECPRNRPSPGWSANQEYWRLIAR